MLSTLEPRTRRLYILILLGFACYGGIFTVAGAALPGIIRAFQWSYTLTGLILSAAPVSFILTTMVCGFLLQKVPPKLILVCGLTAGAAGIFFFARTSSPLLNFLMYFCVGICQGTLEVITNLEVIHMQRDGGSRLMSLVHGVFSLGAIAGPAAVGLLVRAGQPGTGVFAAMAVILMIMAVLFALFRFPVISAEGEGERRGSMRLLADPLLILITLLLLVYVGTEFGASTWLAEYMVKSRGAPPTLGAFTVSLLWAGIGTARLILSSVYRGKSPQYVVLSLAAVSTTALALALAARTTAAAAVLVFATGLGFSGIYPLTMTVLGRHFKSGVAVGMAATGGGIGTLLFPLVMALVSEGAGVSGGFIFCLVMCGALVALAAAVVGIVRVKAGRQA
jgi:fucose permease